MNAPRLRPILRPFGRQVKRFWSQHGGFDRLATAVLSMVGVAGAVIAALNLMLTKGQLQVVEQQLVEMRSSSAQTERSITAASRLADAAQQQNSLVKAEVGAVQRQSLAAEQAFAITRSVTRPSLQIVLIDNEVDVNASPTLGWDFKTSNFETGASDPNSRLRIVITNAGQVGAGDIELSFKWNMPNSRLQVPQVLEHAEYNDGLPIAITSKDGFLSMGMKLGGSIQMPLALASDLEVADIAPSQARTVFLPAALTYAILPAYLDAALHPQFQTPRHLIEAAPVDLVFHLRYRGLGGQTYMDEGKIEFRPMNLSSTINRPGPKILIGDKPVALSERFELRLRSH